MRMLIGSASLLIVAVFLTSLVLAGPRPSDRVSVSVNEKARRVDISVDGQPFTSYIWPSTLRKPVLYPLRSATGTIVTRGFPLEQRPGERVDHPHHAGLWFNYESVTASISGTIPRPSNPKRSPKWAPLSSATSSRQKAVPNRASSTSKPIGSR